MDTKLVGTFPVTTICGSMRYKERMLEIAEQLSLEGWIVICPFVKFTEAQQQNGHPDKIMLDRMHLAKIELSNAIHVVGQHIGESTTKEIAYARARGKVVYYR